MKRILVTAAAWVQPLVVGFLGGVDYTKTGPDLAFIYLSALIVALLVWACPIWEE